MEKKFFEADKNWLKSNFIESDNKKYPFQLGEYSATWLVGFIAGFVVAAAVLIPLILMIL